MKFKYGVICCLTLVLFSVCLSEEKSFEVKLSNGKTAILKPDHTWAYKKKKVIVFKDLKFGSTVQDLKKKYKKQTIREVPGKDIYFFDYDFGYEPCTLLFYFENNYFIKGTALILYKDEDYQFYAQKYFKLKRLLTQLYGQPKSVKELDTTWKFEDYQIDLLLTKHNNQLAIKAIYEWTAFQENPDMAAEDRLDTLLKQVGEDDNQPGNLLDGPMDVNDRQRLIDSLDVD